MKKSSLIIAGLALALAFTGCTKGSSTSDVRNKPSETAFTSAETKYGVEEATTEEPTTEEPTTEETTTEEAMTEEPTVPEQETEYNAEAAKKAFEESDIPESIKSIFLSDGVFVDTVTQTEMKLSEFKISETERLLNIKEWICYIDVDLDNDGKKELFYDVQLQYGFVQRVIFHEHTDGKVYAYRRSNTGEIVSENGDVLNYSASSTFQTLYRYSFDIENIIMKLIVGAAPETDGSYKYYVKGHWVDLAEYETYLKHFWETRMEENEFRITPDAD